MRPGRGRPRAALLGAVVWLLLVVALLASGLRGAAPILLVVGIYLVGPLWIAVRYRVDDAGLLRKTAFGERTYAWNTLGAWDVAAAERVAHVAIKGRGSARFLPALLLLWEADEGPQFAARLATALEARLGPGRVTS